MEHENILQPQKLQVLSDLIMDKNTRVPFNEADTKETTTDTLSTTESQIISASITPRSNSKVLILAHCQVNNDAAITRQITLRLRRGNDTDRPLVQEIVVGLEALAADKTIMSFAITDSPATTTAVPYSIRGVTDAGSPTVTNKSIVVIELPVVRQIK